MAFDHSRKFMDKNAMRVYRAVDSGISKRFGETVRAVEVSNREYQHRYDKLSTSRSMRPPPSSDRIFPGYLVVRKLETPNEYETWIPEEGFEECYELID